MFISYHKLKHIYKILKTDELEIRNSPLDRFATMAAKLILCGKGACETIQPVGSALGFMLASDEILRTSGREPIFTPLIRELLDRIYPGKPNSVSRIWAESMTKLNEIRANDREFQQMSEYIDKDPSLKDLTRNDRDELKGGINILREYNNNQLSDLQKKIQDILNKHK